MATTHPKRDDGNVNIALTTGQLEALTFSQLNETADHLTTAAGEMEGLRDMPRDAKLRRIRVSDVRNAIRLVREDLDALDRLLAPDDPDGASR